MKHIYIRLLFCFCLLTFVFSTFAQQNTCLPPSAHDILDINNVRARINTGGSFFWDKAGTNQYEVPKDSLKHSMFSKSIWLGGLDQNTNLHQAAILYGQIGNDYWTGPLTTDGSATIDNATSNMYDTIFKITRAEVALFRMWYQAYAVSPAHAEELYPGYTIPASILSWPAHGDTSAHYSYYLAPFVDVNLDGNYNPYNGDYPAYDFGELDKANGKLWGDQTLWQVFNDKGGIHTESGGLPLGFEIQNQAFAFVSDDELNDATFYQYTLINRSVNTYSNFFFSTYLDFDLGYAYDDYVGFDVKRGLAYCYNGKNIDGSGHIDHYGENPPAVGIKFFQGPLIDPDGIDNPKFEYLTDPETGEQIQQQMCNESISGQNFGNLIIDDERYGITRFIYFNGSGGFWGSSVPEETSDFYNYQQAIWKDGTPLMYGGNGYPNSGAYGAPCHFMFPGDSDSCYFVTNGIPPNGLVNWSEETVGNMPYDRRGLVSVGPLTVHPGDTVNMIYGILWARTDSGGPLASLQLLKEAADNIETYFESDFENLCQTPMLDYQYNANELEVAFRYFDEAESYYWTFGDGSNSELKNPVHTFEQPGTYKVCLEFKCSCGTRTVCKEITVAYMRNKLSVIIQRIEGHGNGGLELELLPETVDEIMSGAPWKSLTPKYNFNRGPIDVFIPDANFYVQGEYRIWLTGINDTAKWKICKIDGSDTITSQYTIGEGKYEYLPQWGLMVGIKQVKKPGSLQKNNGLLSSSITFTSYILPWITGVSDKEEISPFNWIRSGAIFDRNNYDYIDYEPSETSLAWLDPNENYENVLGGTWAPYRLASRYIHGPAKPLLHSLNKMEDLYSIDVVITEDKSKWSRCPVIETGDDKLLSEGGAGKFELRKHASVDKDGNTNTPEATYDGKIQGMGWFPGYAINVETGERLNVMFGESSWLAGENGRDMLFNPTSRLCELEQYYFGGKHFLYIFGNLKSQTLDISPSYDEGAWAYANLFAGDAVGYRNLYRSILWTSIPLSIPQTSWLAKQAVIKIRVERPYMAAYSSSPLEISENPQNNNLPLYAFNTYNVSVSIDEKHPIAEYLSVKVFPNPFSESTEFQFSVFPDETVSVFMYDITGKQQLSFQNISTNRFLLQKCNLPGGIYLYRVATSKGRYASGSVVIH